MKTLLSALTLRCYDNEEIEKLLEETTGEATGCLMEAFFLQRSRRVNCTGDVFYLVEYNDRPFFDRLFKGIIAKTTDFKGCLRAALTNDVKDVEILEKLFDETKDFTGCLKAALTTGHRDVKFLEKLFEKTEGFQGCLKAGIKSLAVDEEFLEKLFEKTVNFEGCLLAALVTGLSNELIEKIFAKTKDFTGCYRKSTGGDFAGRLLEKTTDFAWCLWTALRNDDYRHLDTLIEKTTDFSGCLFVAIYQKYKLPEQKYLDILLEKTEHAHQCIFWATKKKLPYDFLNRLADKPCTFNFEAPRKNVLGSYELEEYHHGAYDDFDFFLHSCEEEGLAPEILKKLKKSKA